MANKTDLAIIVGEAIGKNKGKMSDDPFADDGFEEMEDDEMMGDEEELGQQLIEAINTGDAVAVFDTIKVIANS